MFPRLLIMLVAWMGAWCGTELAHGQPREQRREAGELQRKIAPLVEPYLKHQIVSGMSIGVLRNGRKWASGYGRLSDDDAGKPDGRTVYEIGSITKVFTGILLADAVSRGELELDQPVRDLLSLPTNQLAQEGQPIQLWHLATHTSGLPRMPANFRPADAENPYADYSLEQLLEFLEVVELRAKPGEKGEYSNLATGLLGHLLAEQANLTYEQLLAKQITGPLRMKSTFIEATPARSDRLAPPHTADGVPSRPWEFSTLAAAGAIRSTADDLLHFLAAQLDPPDGHLGKAIDLAWKPHWEPPDANSGSFTMGLGWQVARDGHTRWHNGQTGGYRSMILVSRRLNLGVVVLSNTATSEVDKLAEDIYRMLAGDTVEPRTFPEAVRVAPDVMSRYVGRYEVAPNFHLDVRLEADRLTVQATGQPEFRIFPESETRWFWKVVDAQLTFHMDEQGRCQRVTLHQNGRDLPGNRLPDDDPPITPERAP